MIVVLHFCNKDAELAKLGLKLAMLLDSNSNTRKIPYNLLLAHDNTVLKTHVASIKALATSAFQNVDVFEYWEPPIKDWPEAPNFAWQQVARHIEEKVKEPWFWWEADAVPLHTGWVDQIANGYKAAGTPFFGKIVPEIGHMNGVMVYPPNTPSMVGVSAMTIRSQAWDVYIKDVSTSNGTNAVDIFQHYWTMTPDGKASIDNNYPAPSFKDWNHVSENIVDFRKATFHRCKDGTLHRLLLEHYKGLHIPTEHEINVPSCTEPDPVVRELPTTPIELPELVPLKPNRTSICIVTHARDIEWLKLSLKCIDKYAKGFRDVLIVYPEQEQDTFEGVDHHGRIRRKMIPFKQNEKGMLHHMVMLMSADEYTTSDYVLFMDTDCMFHTPTKPSDYFSDGKPHYVVRTYESLRDPKCGVSDCAQWQSVVKAALGWEPEWYTMCRHPSMWPVNLLKPLREHLSSLHDKPFDEYVLSHRDKFPQSFAEYPTMGAWAMRYAYDHFFWIDCSNGLAPKDRMKNHWSLGGVDQKMPDGRTAKENIEEYL